MKKILSILISFILCLNLNIDLANAAQKKTAPAKVTDKKIVLMDHSGTYTGYFSNGKANGYGTFHYHDSGDCYMTGTWKNNFVNGKSSLTLIDTAGKIVLKGYATNNNFNGYKELYMYSGSTYSIIAGNFGTSYDTGKGLIKRYVGGILIYYYTGWLKDGSPNGYGTEKYYSGSKCTSSVTGNFKDGKKIIDLNDYYKITEGMSYSDVASILGSDGEEQSSGSISTGDDTILTIYYRWKIGDALVDCMFQNDKLITKAQGGLK